MAGPFALHAHRDDNHAGDRPASGEQLQHVADGRTGRAGDESNRPRVRWQALLAARVEVALRLQFLAELLQGEFESPDAFGLNLFDGKLVFAMRRIDRQPAARDHLHAVARLKTDAQADTAIEDRAESRSFVFERQVNVARTRA